VVDAVVARTGFPLLVVVRNRVVEVGKAVVVVGIVVAAADVSTATGGVGCPDPMALGTETSRPARLTAQVTMMIVRRRRDLRPRRCLPAMGDPPRTGRRDGRGVS
jgi:hypothetical protein